MTVEHGPRGTSMPLASMLPPSGPCSTVTVAGVDSASYEPWTDDAVEIDTLMERPDGVAVTGRGTFSDTTLTEIALANGARVVFMPTDIRADVVVFGAASRGGWSLLDAEDVAEAQMVADIVSRSGVGEYDQVTLDRFLSGVNVSLTPYVDEAEEAVAEGDAASTSTAWIFPTLTANLVIPNSVNWDVRDATWCTAVVVRIIIIMVAMVITSPRRTRTVRSSS